MKVLVQRVKEAQVDVDGEVTGSIGPGMLLLICFEQGDDDSKVQRAIEKIVKLRIFDDVAGKMNLDVTAVQGEILSVSQFTLSWDGSGGHRPSFERSMAPQEARLKYALFNRDLRGRGISVQEGKFGATMRVGLVNDGPVTFMLEF